MQLFIASHNPTLIRQLEIATGGQFAESVNLAVFPPSAPSSQIAQQLDLSALVIADCSGIVTPFMGWLIGVSCSIGTPVVAYAGKDERPEQGFIPLRDVVTVVDSLTDAGIVANRLARALSDGMEAYAQAATEIHTKFVQERPWV